LSGAFLFGKTIYNITLMEDTQMGMKRKRLAYVKKYGKKFAAWLRTCGRLDPIQPPAASTPTEPPAPAPAAAAVSEAPEEQE
jgi:hypothetical protein